MSTKENEKVIKIKTVEDYIKRVAELQRLYSDACYLARANVNSKEFTLELAKKCENNKDFNEAFKIFIENVKKINALTQEAKLSLDYNNIKLDPNMFKLEQNIGKQNVKDIEVPSIEKLISILKSIDPDYGEQLSIFWTENYELVNDILKFCNDNKEFIYNYIGDILNIMSLSDNKEKELEYFFRGQANKEHPLLASVFRSNIKEYESIIVNNTLSDKFDEFSECKTMYEKLTKMQHYQVPTRIMDITGNSLASLYFACETTKAKCDKFKNCNDEKSECTHNTETDGAVFLFLTNKGNTSYPDSDKVRILSNMSRLSDVSYCATNYNFDIYKYITETFYKYLYFVLIDSSSYDIIVNEKIIDEIESKLEDENFDESIDTSEIEYIYRLFLKYLNKNTIRPEFSDSIEKILKLVLGKNLSINNKTDKSNQTNKIIEANKFINDLDKYIHQRSCEMCTTVANCSNRLVNMIREEKPGFESRINATDMSRWLIVRGAKNNSRIKIQDGHFIIVPKILNDHLRLRPFEIHKKKFDEDGYEKLIEFNDLTENDKKFFNEEHDFNNLRKGTLGSEAFIHKIIIDAESKKTILNQLESMGITKATVYPELSSYGEYIKEKYS